MFLRSVFVLICVSTIAVSKVIQDEQQTLCRISEFSCADGTCVRVDAYCDGTLDCNDGSDEASCFTGIGAPSVRPVLHRSKKQVRCRDDEWRCRDESCINYTGKCDGKIDCDDGSDEIEIICRDNMCGPAHFRCDYGACVDISAPCNGVSDCADNSDELLPRCFSSRDEVKCGPNHFRCDYGACVDNSAICNGVSDCADNSDELLPRCSNATNLASAIVFRDDMVITRKKRQSSNCQRNQWQCRDGSCISFHGKCDGNKDCPDGSDETHALCRNNKCQSNWFRCTYGACVDGTAPCDGVQDCADNSDELLPRCRNETEEVRGQFKCDNGQIIPASAHCDGVRDCADGSDETVRTCAGKECPSYLFQCAYGACVDQGADCNGKQECADGSDESDELCNRVSIDPIPGVVVNPVSGGACILPPYPNHGSYVVTNVPNARPGQTFDTVALNITCIPGYRLQGKKERICLYGTWSEEVTDCVRFCRLKKDPSVEYRCLYTGNSQGSRICEEYEADGTSVRPECVTPNYYYTGVLPYMRCVDGSWDYVARCQPECGRVTPKGVDLVIGGRIAEKGELPWHAGIYKKTTTPYMQICGGSLVSNKVVISAAHCFWNDSSKALPASDYAVALGKLYRPWNYKGDTDVQKADVTDIRMPSHFQGGTTNFQDDIALLILSIVVEYKPHIRPVCVDFNIVFERTQLSAGNLGKVAGWGLTAENGKASQVLKVVELPYITIEECQTDAPLDFREYITGDKICAGFRNGTALCRGDSGGGLAFSESDRGVIRYYLRGIVSTAPNNDNLCNAYWLTTFTQISRHEHFIKEFI